MTKVTGAIKNEEVMSLIEQSIETATVAKECVIITPCVRIVVTP